MITRSKLVEQLRDYQIRSQHRADVTVAILWALLILLLVISSYVTLYLRHFWLSFVMVCLGILLVIRLRISKQALARKRERRLLLPLSMWALLYPALGFQLNNLARAGLQLVHRLTSCHWWKSGCFQFSVWHGMLILLNQPIGLEIEYCRAQQKEWMVHFSADFLHTYEFQKWNLLPSQKRWKLRERKRKQTSNFLSAPCFFLPLNISYLTCIGLANYSFFPPAACKFVHQDSLFLYVSSNQLVGWFPTCLKKHYLNFKLKSK